MNLWPVEHFFEHICHPFDFGWVCCCTHPKVMKNMFKKVFNWSKVHLSEVTFYKIHTLALWVVTVKNCIRRRIEGENCFPLPRKQNWHLTLLCFSLVFLHTCLFPVLVQGCWNPGAGAAYEAHVLRSANLRPRFKAVEHEECERYDGYVLRGA